MNLEADCKKIVDETVDYARQGMEDFKKEERAMIQEMKEEFSRQEEQAAELNYQLQEGIDELVEKLNKQNVPTLRIEELDQGGHDIPIEAFATPKGNANVEAGATPVPNTASNLAPEAREILHSVFSTIPAGSTAPPQLPPLPAQGHQQDTAQREPSVRSPAIAVSETDKLKTADVGAGLSGQQLLDLITRLTSKDAGGEKPRPKEAETIKLNDMPAPEAYCHWRNHVRDEVKSCSDQPDEAWIWLNEVFDNKTWQEKLEEKLQEPGKFITLDTKLSAALNHSTKGGLAIKIHNFKDEKPKDGIQVRGSKITSGRLRKLGLLPFDRMEKRGTAGASARSAQHLSPKWHDGLHRFEYPP